MRAVLPYHFCAAPECHEMTPEGVEFCEWHTLGVYLDKTLPAFSVVIESTPTDSRSSLSPAASQETNQQTTSVPGDADSEESIS